jgi:hypothetical protein
MVWVVILGVAIGCFLYGDLKCTTKSKITLYMLSVILAVISGPIAIIVTYRMFHDDWGLLVFRLSSASPVISHSLWISA